MRAARLWARCSAIAVTMLAASSAGATERTKLDAGDRAWTAGERSTARDAWRSAATGADPAVRAQAEARLLLVSGNLGLAIHGPRAEAALGVCSEQDPWCALAAADLVLFGREVGVPLPLVDAVRNAQAVADDLPGPALARLVWAGAAPLQMLDATPLDALGRAILHGNGSWPSGPGTWVVGVGAAGASGQGPGGGLRFVHPDVALRGWHVDGAALLTRRRAWQASLRLVSPGAWGVEAVGQGARLVADRYSDAGDVEPLLVRTGALQLLPGYRTPSMSLRLGPIARWDTVGPASLAGHGAALRVGWAPKRGTRDAQLTGGVQAAFADYHHQQADISLRLLGAGGRFAGWMHGAAAPWSAAPYWRLPAAGGGQVLRHGAIGRFRARTLAAIVAEWRMRPDAIVGGAAFLEGANIDGWHGGFGAGLRLRLPPRPHNTVRVDAAWGDGGLGISAGWGEAF